MHAEQRPTQEIPPRRPKSRERPPVDDTLGPPILDAGSIRSHREALARRSARQDAEDYRKIVAKELELGRNPETYWKQLNDEYDARSRQRRIFVAKGGVGSEKGHNADLTRKIRYEMNALIPHVAEARVRADIKRYADLGSYVSKLEHQLARAEAVTESSEGDETVLRSAIDTAHMLREQIATARRLAVNADGWRKLRAATFRGETRSVLEELPADAMEPLTLQDEIDALCVRRDGLKFWNVFQRAELAQKIDALVRRQKYEARKKAAPPVR